MVAGYCPQNGDSSVTHLPINMRNMLAYFWVNIVSKKLRKMGAPVCKTQYPCVSTLAFWERPNCRQSTLSETFSYHLSNIACIYQFFLHFVHLAVGFQMISSTRSSQIDWADVVVITRIFLDRDRRQFCRGVGSFAIIFATKSTWSAEIVK